MTGPRSVIYNDFENVCEFGFDQSDEMHIPNKEEIVDIEGKVNGEIVLLDYEDAVIGFKSFELEV